jgi:hypothetical protein
MMTGEGKEKLQNEVLHSLYYSLLRVLLNQGQGRRDCRMHLEDETCIQNLC